LGMQQYAGADTCDNDANCKMSKRFPDAFLWVSRGFPVGFLTCSSHNIEQLNKVCIRTPFGGLARNLQELQIQKTYSQSLRATCNKSWRIINEEYATLQSVVHFGDPGTCKPCFSCSLRNTRTNPTVSCSFWRPWNMQTLFQLFIKKHKNKPYSQFFILETLEHANPVSVVH